MIKFIRRLLFSEAKAPDGHLDFSKHAPMINYTLEEMNAAYELVKKGNSAGFSLLASYYSTSSNPEMKPFYLYWLTHAANSKDPESMLNLGREYFYATPPDYEMAFPLLKEAAEKGIWQAQSYLADMYNDGLGVKRSKELSRYWREIILSDNKDPFNYSEACYQLALLLLDETSGPLDYPRAINLLMQAANNEHRGAYIALAECYENGNGVEKNPEKAAEWYNKDFQKTLHEHRMRSSGEWG